MKTVELKPHKSNPENDFQVSAQYEVLNEKIIVEVSVSSKSKTENINPKFSSDRLDNIGLWDFDVVEVFIQREDPSNHYLELQVSPLGQKFALIVKEPRKQTEQVKQLVSKISSKKTELGFKGHFEVEVTDIPGASNNIKANFFACLGPKDARCYFAFNINNDTEPDYHRPELFKKIGSLNQ